MKPIITSLILVLVFMCNSYSQCSDPYAGEDFAVCGNTVDLSVENATTGYWSVLCTTNECLIDFNDINSLEPEVELVWFPEPNIIVNFIWHDDSGPCTDTVQVEFVEIPTANAGEDAIVCGTCIELETSFGNGEWLDPCVFEPCIGPMGDIACVTSYESFIFVWQESNYAITSPTLICTDQDEMIVTFYEVPTPQISLETTDTIVYSLTFNNLTAQEPGTGITGFWDSSNPATHFGDEFSNNTWVTVPEYGTYDFYWVEFSGPTFDTEFCSNQDGPLTIHFLNPVYFEKENSQENKVSIFPNPASEDIFISSDEKIQSVEIYDVNGRIVLSQEENLEVIDVSQLDSGIYFLHAYIKDVQIIRKFVRY